MTKHELIKLLKDKHTEIQLKEIASLVDIFFDMMKDTLTRDGRVEIRGFGTFSIRNRAARKARNPRTGESVFLKPRKVVYFRAGKSMKDKVNSSAS